MISNHGDEIDGDNTKYHAAGARKGGASRIAVWCQSPSGRPSSQGAGHSVGFSKGMDVLSAGCTCCQPCRIGAAGVFQRRAYANGAGVWKCEPDSEERICRSWQFSRRQPASLGGLRYCCENSRTQRSPAPQPKCQRQIASPNSSPTNCSCASRSPLPTHLARPFRIMCTASIPCIVRHAIAKDWYPLVSQTRFFETRWSCSTTLFRHLHWRSRQQRLVLIRNS